MAIGSWVRRVLPARAERMAARAYRGIFVDLDKVAERLASRIPPDARLLDIGGGDGDLLNRLLALRDDITVDMVDIAPQVGTLLDPRHGGRIRRFPSTPIERHALAHAGYYGAALISDVMHHVPREDRSSLLRAMADCIAPRGVAFIKDVEPGHPRAALGWWCDRYLSGDRGVSLVSREALRAIAYQALAVERFEEIGLYSIDRPNYIVQISLPDTQ